MNFNNITYQRLSYLKYHIEDELKQSRHRNGIYYWVYWPKFDEQKIKKDDLLDIITEYSNKKLVYSESFSGEYKFEGKLYEQWFRDNGNLFGLTPSKHKKLIQFLDSRQNIITFSTLFQELCFARPFYIGKANDLQSRLKKHFNRSQSTILDQIDSVNISHTEIWVGYRLIDDPNESGLNNIFEEIFSRTFKPGLTKRPY